VSGVGPCAKVLLGAEAGGLGQAFRQVGAAASALRGPTEAQAERLATAFRKPLQRGLLIVQARDSAHPPNIP
jgi:sorting nexin-1/2